MSYDIRLTVDLGRGPVGVGDLDWNYTYNIAPMCREAGFTLGEFNGKPAGDCAVVLKRAIREMEDDPPRFEKHNPENGWGSYETLLPRLRVLLSAFEEAPKAIVEVS